jgi:hypothetical protein
MHTLGERVLHHSVAEIVGASHKRREKPIYAGISDAHKSLKLQNGKQPGQLLRRKNKLLKSCFHVQRKAVGMELCDGCPLYTIFAMSPEQRYKVSTL